MALLEIACFNVQSAIVASESGADRVELCDNADLGGTTPPLEWLRQIEDKVTVPINVMIRPRGGDFVYTDLEFQSMKNSIKTFKSAGMINGFVFGILNHDHAIDVARTTDLTQLAAPLPCTFHRAFDESPNPLEAVEDVVSCGINTILTSGGASDAAQGHGVLAQLVEKAAGRITIMPGGGVRSTNIDMLKRETDAPAYHSSALLGSGVIANALEIEKMKTKVQQGP